MEIDSRCLRYEL